jgi:hypothetical protein
MRVSVTQITNQRPFLMQFNCAHGAEGFTGAASGAEIRINVNLAQVADPDSPCRALCAVPLLAGLTNHRIVEALLFYFDHLDAAGAPAHSPRMKKGAADLTPPAPRTLGWIEEDHGVTFPGVQWEWIILAFSHYAFKLLPCFVLYFSETSTMILSPNQRPLLERMETIG